MELQLLGQQAVVDAVEPLLAASVLTPPRALAPEAGSLEQALAAEVVAVDLGLDAAQSMLDQHHAAGKSYRLGRDARAADLGAEHYPRDLADMTETARHH